MGNTSKPWNKNGSTPTQIITAIQLFLICLAISFVLYRFCCKRNERQTKQQEIYQNDTVAYQQTYPNDRIEHQQPKF